jgi:hypothetical protein
MPSMYNWYELKCVDVVYKQVLCVVAACKCDCHAPTTILKPVSDPVSSVLGTAANAAGAPIVIGM